MIAQHDSSHGQSGRDGQREWVTFHAAGDRAEDREAGLLVVARVAEHNGGVAARLFAACLWIEYQPADGADFRDVCLLGICFRARRTVGGQNGDRHWGVRGSDSPAIRMASVKEPLPLQNACHPPL